MLEKLKHLKSPIPSTGLKKKKPSKALKTMFQQTEATPSAVTGQARATTMVSITGQPHPGARTPGFLQGLAPCCLHLPRTPAFILQATPPQAGWSSVPEGKLEITAGRGRRVQAQREGYYYLDETSTEKSRSSSCGSEMQLSRCHILPHFCEWYHPNATWETPESFFDSSPPLSFNTADQPPKGVRLVLE